MRFMGGGDTSIGLDISDFTVEIVQLEKAQSKIGVTAYSRFGVPSGMISNGVIHDVQGVKDVLKKGISSAQYGRFSKGSMYVAVPEAKVFTHTFDASATLNEEELVEEVEKSFLTVVPYNSDELYWDWRELFRDTKKKRISVVGAPKVIIDSYIDLVSDLGFMVQAFDTHSYALSRALVKQKKKGVSYAILDIGAVETNMEIFDSSGLLSTYTYPRGGNHFTQALEKELHLPAKKAEILKRKVGLDIESEKYGRVAFILQKELRVIIEELEKTLEFHEKENGIKVGAIILAGGVSMMPHLTTYVAENLGVKAGVGIPWVDSPEPMSKREKVLFAGSIGLALRHFQKYHDINLLKKKTKRSSHQMMKTFSSIFKH